MKHRLFQLLIAFTLVAATPKAISAREWSEIQSQQQLKVAVKDNLRPLGFTDKNGALVGLEIDIARQLAVEMLGEDSTVEFLPVNNIERLQMLLEDEVDLTIARVAVTTSRSRIVDFSSYYYLDGTGIITKNSQIENAKSLSLKKVAVLEDSATIAVIRHRLPNVTLVGVDSYQAALELLESDRVDGFAGDRSILTGWIQEYPKYKLLQERISGAALAIVMPKGLQYKELRQQVNLAIAKWQQSGWLQSRIDYWGL